MDRAAIAGLLSAALDDERAGRDDQAAERYRAVLERQPDLAAAAVGLAVILARRGETDQAFRLFRRGLALETGSAAFWIAMAQAAQDAGRPDEARRLLLCAARLEPRQPALHAGLARIDRQAGRRAAAAGGYQRALVLDPARGEDLFWLAMVLNGLSDYEASITVLKAMVAAWPEAPEGWLNLGVHYQQKGAFDDALAVFGRAALCPRVDPRLLRRHRGQTLLMAGELDGAEKDLAAAGDETALARCRLHRRIQAGAGCDPDPGLVLSGSLADTSGYAYFGRQFAERLLDAGRRIWRVDGAGAAPRLDLAESHPRLAALDQPLRARLQLAIALPPVVERIPGLKTVNFTMFEAARLPAHWIGQSLRHDLVIVPTRSSFEAWADSGMPAERIALCPLGVDPARHAPVLDVSDSAGRRVLDYRTRILNISDLSVRKNIDGLFRVWLTATSASDDAALILKAGKGHDRDNAVIGSLLRHAAAQVGRQPADAAPIFVLTGRFPDAVMDQLLATATHYWSMSHGEGWDLPMTQAGSLGLGLIAPAHSAYLDYLDETVATMLPVRRVRAADLDGSPCHGFVGLEWWKPDESAAAAALADIVAGRAPARSARGRLSSRFTWDRASHRLMEILDGL
ncbi:MAG: tetratricopeptide repeat protein [Caulobacter sp.]|nr:tetratricopeptide repeat protein [Caulobacter sp.]